MGEYATRIFDGQRIKIGTCELMYYLRYEDRTLVLPIAGNVDPSAQQHQLFFRLPFPDEDNVKVGDYQEFRRGLRLWKPSGVQGFHSDFAPEWAISSVGTMQLKHESGLLLNVPCYHGLRLPEVVAPMKAFWNGRGHFFELAHLKPTLAEGIKPVVRCRACNTLWSCEWSEVWEYVQGDIRYSLRQYAEKPVVA